MCVLRNLLFPYPPWMPNFSEAVIPGRGAFYGGIVWVHALVTYVFFQVLLIQNLIVVGFSQFLNDLLNILYGILYVIRRHQVFVKILVKCIGGSP